MPEIPSLYRLVQLDSPFDQWHDPSVRQLFERMISLRINGYGRKYPRGVIPFDISCWYARHFLVCEYRAGLKPVMGFQAVTLEAYRRHHAPFALLAACRQAGCVRHIRAMEELVARFEERPDKLSYTGGFTIDPELKANRNLVHELLQVMVVLHCFFHEDAGEGHEIVAAPTVRFKVDRLLSDYGFFPLVAPGEDGDQALLRMASYAGEQVRIMRVQRFNREMAQLAQNYKSWWDNRVLLGGEQQRAPSASAASVA